MGDGGFNEGLRYSELGRLNLSRANAAISTHDQPASRKQALWYGIKPSLIWNPTLSMRDIFNWLGTVQ